MRKVERITTRALLVPSYLVMGIVMGWAGAALAEETVYGKGRAADAAATFPVALVGARTVVSAAAAEVTSDSSPLGQAKDGRRALDQPGCSVCLTGAASVTWNGSSGSFHVDRIVNTRSSGYSGPLSVTVVLSGPLPTYGQTISGAYTLSNALSLAALQAGYQYTAINSGTLSFFGSSIPAGVYWQLLFLSENVSGTWYYADWIVMDKKVVCTGTACSTINTTSCTEDAYTMCLSGGRYRVTGRWRNQYAGGVQANLQKAKLTDVTGSFWIQDANTYEFMVRMSTGTDNGRAWVSILTFTDVEFWLAITDVTNGQTKEYHSNPGNRTLIFDPSFFVYP
jgi:hypothetical protein